LRWLSPEALAARMPVRLQGVITFKDTNQGRAFLQDETADILIKGDTNSLSGAPGQFVEVEGISGLVDEDAAVLNPRLKILGPASAPRGRKTSIHHILAGHHANQFVSVSAVVRMVLEKKGKLLVHLAQDGSRILAEVADFDLASVRQLVGADVRVDGVCVWTFFRDGRKDSPRLLVADARQIVVEHPAPDRASLPVLTPKEVLDISAANWGEHRKRVRGVVTFYYSAWPGSQWYLFFQAEEGAFFVRLAQPAKVKEGDLVDVYGFPGPGPFAPVLEDSEIELVGKGPLPSPVLLTPKTKEPWQLDARLATVEGRLVSQNSRGGYVQLGLSDETDPGWLANVFIAKEPTDKAPQTFAPGAKLSATGVLSAKYTQPDHPPELELLVASPSDVTVLGSPPWKAREFLIVGGPLVILLLMSVALVFAQRKHIRHIAQAKRTEALLRESEKFAATGRMAARIAHEINNPLAGILNSFALVKDALPPDAETQRWAGMMEREIGRIARIVRRMFELYGKQKDQPEEVRFDQLLTEVADLMKGKALRRQVNVSVASPCPAIPGRQMAGALMQVLYNLVSNAIEASPAGGNVELGLAQNNGAVLLTVRDHGPGIPAETREKIFEPFFSTKNGAADAGMGLGLAVSRSLVEAMAGRLDFVSLDDEGTIFKVEVPVSLPRFPTGQ